MITTFPQTTHAFVGILHVPQYAIYALKKVKHITVVLPQINLVLDFTPYCRPNLLPFLSAEWAWKCMEMRS